MKTIIAGSRTIKDLNEVIKAIYLSGFNITEVVCGGARGVDDLGRKWSGNGNIVPVKIFNALWDELWVENVKIKYNKYDRPYNSLAGFNRNKEMVKYAEALIAVWDGKSHGTKDMIRLAKENNLKVYIHKVLYDEKKYNLDTIGVNLIENLYEKLYGR